MTTINLYYIGGVITPPALNCAQESELMPKVSELFVWDEECDVENCKQVLKQNFDPSDFDSDYWKVQTILHFKVSSLFSLVFLPSKLEEEQTFFIQKYKSEPPYDGFWAPYLSENRKEKYGCIERPDRADEINNQEDIERSIEGIGSELNLDIKAFLQCFLKDTWSAMVGFTYLNEDGKKTTRCWYKRV